MAKQSDSKVPYVNTLDKVSKERYLQKITLIGGADPYELPSDKWKRREEMFPSISYPDIVNYLLFSKNFYTQEEMRAWKSLEAYNQLTSELIHDVAVVIISSYHVVRGKVLHSQSLQDKPFRPWVIADKSGTIQTANCDCMAELVEACTHIATLLFAVDATVQIRDFPTVNQAPPFWLLPESMKNNFKRISEIDFTSKQTRKRNLDQATASGTAISRRVRHSRPIHKPSPAALDKFLHELNQCNPKPVILSLIPPYNKSFIPRQAQDASPQSPPE